MVLRPYLAGQLRPLTVLLFVVVALAAPLAYYVMASQTVHEQAVGVARNIAQSMATEIRGRPVLWRYESAKLQRHLDAYLDRANTVQTVMSDGAGWRIEAGSTNTTATARHPLTWAIAPVEANAEHFADVWVGATLQPVVNQAQLLFGAFAVLAAALAGAFYWLPLRSMGHAQLQIQGLFQQLQQSQHALHELNENLEQQVTERADQLQTASVALQTKERTLRELSTRTVAAQTAERRALARELHDSAGQALTAIRIHLQRLSDQAPPGSLAEQVGRRTIGLADAAMDEIRRVVDRLSPAILDDLGLVPAIRRSCEDFSERTGIEIDYRVEGIDPLPGNTENRTENRTESCIEGRTGSRMESSIETACYRVVQEALTNVARHAQASSVEVALAVRDTSLRIIVADDGLGFDPRATCGRTRHGLHGMRERVMLLGGTVDVQTTLGRGTRIEVNLPTRPSVGHV